MKRLAIISPCLNEDAMLPHTIPTLMKLLSSLKQEGKIADDSFLLFVDDGSSDATWSIITEYASKENASNSEKSGEGKNPKKIRGIRLSKQCGHQAALLAGMETALPDCDVCITIDADLQDDPDTIPEMLEAHEKGADIVFGVRRHRDNDSWLKKSSASFFYRTMRNLGVESVYNHADFRLMSSKAVADLLDYEERNLFLRGLVPLLGYRQECVYYDRNPRIAGKSKYPFRKMFDFAIDGITSFSVRPVRMLFWLGIAFMLTAICMGCYVIFRHFSGETIEGWTSLILSIWFCTGMLLMGLGIIGEYIGKIYIEVKKRPRYRIAERV